MKDVTRSKEVDPYWHAGNQHFEMLEKPAYEHIDKELVLGRYPEKEHKQNDELNSYFQKRFDQVS